MPFPRFKHYSPVTLYVDYVTDTVTRWNGTLARDFFITF
jgi:hypothetical protein